MKNKKKTITIELDKWKDVLLLTGCILLFITAIIFFGKLLIPALIALIYGMLGLVKYWIVHQDNELIFFFGGIIGIIIGYKIWSLVVYYWTRLIERIIKKFIEIINR